MRVAFLAECHLKQKAGYVQHTSPILNAHSLDNGIIAQFIIHLQKQAYAEPTIRTKYKILRVMIDNNVNLDDPEEVKLFIARRRALIKKKTQKGKKRKGRGFDGI